MGSFKKPTSFPVQHYNDWPNDVGFDSTYEEQSPIELKVSGSIPAYAAGVLFRTSTGPRSINNKDGKLVCRMTHWFDGFSQIHRFQLHAPPSTVDKIQRVTYNSRLTCDKLIDRIRKTGKIDEITFASNYEPCRTLYQKVQSVFQKAPVPAANEVNNAITMSINYPGLSTLNPSHMGSSGTNKLTTLCNKTDNSRIQFINPITLEPTSLASHTNLHPVLKGEVSAAHAETDPRSGDVFNYNLGFGGRLATYRVFKTNGSTGKTSILATFEQPGAYIHSLFLTEHFVVVCVWNSHFTQLGLSILWQQNLLDAMCYNDKLPARWYVIDRRCPDNEGGRGIVAVFESDPFFAFHSVNAYEVPSGQDDGSVDLLCDVVVFSNTDVLHDLYVENLMSSCSKARERSERISKGRSDQSLPRLRRYRLPNVPTLISNTTDKKINKKVGTKVPTAKRAVVDFTTESSECPELPNIHPAYRTTPYRYVYGTLLGTKSTFVEGLVKYDLQTKSSIGWEVKGHTPGEPIFIPRPGEDNEEDDGVLLSVILNGYTEKSYLLCLDAKNLKELGRIEVDGVVGFGFHGIWAGAKDL